MHRQRGTMQFWRWSEGGVILQLLIRETQAALGTLRGRPPIFSGFSANLQCLLETRTQPKIEVLQAASSQDGRQHQGMRIGTRHPHSLVERPICLTPSRSVRLDLVVSTLLCLCLCKSIPSVKPLRKKPDQHETVLWK